MLCPACNGENEPGRKFCGECGGPLAQVCASCGASNPAHVKFCGECGTALGVVATAPPGQAGAVSERRLVSVLFADLVGFTAASEGRDAEETRELLSRYFDTCRTLVDRYGGTVEKFIGDAVMAVWGTPVAQEDDAERAVRAALDLAAAVPELGASLRARVGVLTGEVAVTLGADGQGMVAGDAVNTASRIQTAAEPGAVLVGEATKHATDAAIAYEDAGEHLLKGKREPERLWRALRVTAARRGALKAEGLEAPFVGRDRDLRLVKELFHAAAEDRKAHLVSVFGIAGIGKSRLAWEFEKYIDGLADDVWWHRGRCLAYGEGVAYWALAEMVRMRARIGEEEAAGIALQKLEACLAEHVPDGEERRWLEPRLLQLLGLGDSTAAGRQELFSAWRLFFERLADHGACVLVFEDLQWAEPGLLDFIDHLLEWSRSHPLFVVALARPELAGRRESLASGSRNATTLTLEPLSRTAMEALLDGLAPGLPNELRDELLTRAEGVPLYAVETVRMLLDRGLLERAGDVYRPTRPIESLAVPETLHALLAARLDGLDAEERALVQDAAVLGKTFTRDGLAALSGRAGGELDAILAGLVRKEVFSLQSDPRSPERGQFGFLQDLLKRVAYETLSRKERKTRHLAAAGHLASAWADEQEIVEVVASHYLDAYRLLPDAEDAPEIKRLAREALARAGERAASLAATVEAARVFAAAAELADDPLEEAGLRARAGRAANTGAEFSLARTELERAHSLYEQAGATRETALTVAALAHTDVSLNESDRALERLERAYELLSETEPDEGTAAVVEQLARLHVVRGSHQRAEELADQAIGLAERLWLPEILAQALNTAGLLAGHGGRPQFGLALLKHSLAIALENDFPMAALRAYNNLSDKLDRSDRYAEALELQDSGLALARKIGSRGQEWRLLGERAYCLVRIGRWDEAAEIVSSLGAEGLWSGAGRMVAFELALRRGDMARAREMLTELETYTDPAAYQIRMFRLEGEAMLRNGEGDHERALEAARDVVGSVEAGSVTKLAYVEALTAGRALGRVEVLGELLDRIDALPRTLASPMLDGHALRFRAPAAPAPEQRFKQAAALLREYELIPDAALVDLEHGEWLVAQGRAADAAPHLAGAREVFERLRAAPWLERLDRVAPAEPERVPEPA